MYFCPGRNASSAKVPDLIFFFFNKFQSHVCKYSCYHLNTYIISYIYVASPFEASPIYYSIPMLKEKKKQCYTESDPNGIVCVCECESFF